MIGPLRRKSPATVCQLAGAAEIEGADFDDEDTLLPKISQWQLRLPPPRHGIGDVPANFNPADCPIIAQHWFGIHPANGTAHARDLRFQRDVQRLHRLGPRALHEFLVQVGAERSIKTLLEDQIGAFANLDLDVLAALAGDQMPPTPIHRVGR